MCLIITGKAKKVRSTLLNTPNLLSDIYNSNADGIGFMYGTAKGLKVIKGLPQTLQAAREIIMRIPNDQRDVAIHFRMTTHGHTDMHNCHPYDVVSGHIAMMHNGILSTGNKANTAKSDTWHFIKDYLQEPLQHYPDLAYSAPYLNMIAEMIGNNRFVFMNGAGQMSHVNFDQGIEHDDMWFSNTYAWRPAALIPNYREKYQYPVGGYSKYYDYDDYEGIGGWSTGTNVGKHTNLVPTQPKYSTNVKSINSLSAVTKDVVNEAQNDSESFEQLVTFYEFMQAVQQSDVEVVYVALEQNIALLDSLYKEFVPTQSPYCEGLDLTKRDHNIMELILAADVENIVDYIAVVPGGLDWVSEVMCYYVLWEPIPEMPTAQDTNDDSGIAESESALTEAPHIMLLN